MSKMILHVITLLLAAVALGQAKLDNFFLKEEEFCYIPVPYNFSISFPSLWDINVFLCGYTPHLALTGLNQSSDIAFEY